MPNTMEVRGTSIRTRRLHPLPTKRNATIGDKWHSGGATLLPAVAQGVSVAKGQLLESRYSMQEACYSLDTETMIMASVGHKPQVGCDAVAETLRRLFDSSQGDRAEPA